MWVLRKSNYPMSINACPSFCNASVKVSLIYVCVSASDGFAEVSTSIYFNCNRLHLNITKKCLNKLEITWFTLSSQLATKTHALQLHEEWMQYNACMCIKLWAWKDHENMNPCGCTYTLQHWNLTHEILYLYGKW